jgi:pimeloyl-ACP methyl ester carboxylesterase
MASVASMLFRHRGVLEPLQTGTSIEDQVNELTTVIRRDGELPVTLVGHSWGAWLSFIVASRTPELVAKVIMVGAGPFEDTQQS